MSSHLPPPSPPPPPPLPAYVAAPPPPPVPGQAATPPRVLKWYRVYAGALAAAFLGIILLGIALPVIDPGRQDDMPAWFVPAAMIGCSLPFLAAYVAAFFVPAKPWAWTYHLVLIAGGLTSACCMPVCIALLIAWLKPETKAYFGRV